MGVLTELTWVILHLACTAIDMMLVLILVRVVARRWQLTWVHTINEAARGIVDRFLALLRSCWNRLMTSSLSEQGTLVLSMAVLSLARFLICVMAGYLLQ